MKFSFHCPHCDAELEKDSQYAGDLIPCPGCKEKVMVPLAPVGTGTIVGGYRILRRLGSGGMGDVYLAEQKSMSRLVALKVLPASLARENTFLERFLSEIQMQGALNHPGIAVAYDAGCDRDIYYLAMEYVDGYNLVELLKNTGKLPERTALTISRKVAAGLAYAWQKRHIIHRDIKPGNIMIGGKSDIKILDLGLSKSLMEFAHESSVSAYVMGTPLYMSPEQAAGVNDLDCRSDIYSLGVTLYQMVTGKPPYPGKTLVEVITNQSKGEFPDPRERTPGLSSGCVQMLNRMMMKDREDRYANWEDLIKDLERVLAGKRPLHAEPESEISPPSTFSSARYDAPKTNDAANRRLAPPAVILLALLLGLGGFGVLTQLEREPKNGPAVAKVADAPPPDVPPALTRPPREDPAELARQRDLQDVDQALRTLRQERPESPEAWAAHRAALAGLLERAASLGMPSLVARIQDEIRVMEDRKNTALSKALETLAAQAEQLAGDKQFDRAVALYLAYQGPYFQETEPARKAMAAAYQEKARQAELADQEARELALASYEELLEEVIGTIITNRKAGAAIRLIQQKQDDPIFNPLSEKLGDLNALIVRAASLDRVILQSYTNDVDQEIEVLFPDGSRILTIDQVHPTYVEASRVLEQGTVGLSFSVDDVALQEKTRRLQQYAGPDTALLMGMLALRENRARTAAGYFKEFDHPLTRRLGERLEELMLARTEAERIKSSALLDADAEWAFQQLLKTARLSTAPGEAEANQDALRASNYSEEERTRIRLEAQRFMGKYEKSRVALQNKPLLSLMTVEKSFQQPMQTTLHQALVEKNPGYNGKGLFKISRQQVVAVDLSEAGVISDISPLKGLPLVYIKLAGPSIIDIGALAGMPLQTVILYYTGVSDLSVLAGMDVKVLSLNGSSNIRDLAPLKDLPLTSLDIQNTPIDDLQILAGKKLRSLYVGYNIKSIKVAEGMPLVNLGLQGSQVTSLLPIRNLKLESLDIANTHIRDLSPLKNQPLRMLRLNPQTISKGMEVLRELESLQNIGIENEAALLPIEEFWTKYEAGAFDHKS